jgi:hypothetical protein
MGKQICDANMASSGSHPVQFNRVYHDGPVIASLSKVPDGQDVREYDGSAQWVKIFTMGADPDAGIEKPFWLPNMGAPTSGTPPRVSEKLVSHEDEPLLI